MGDFWYPAWFIASRWKYTFSMIPSPLWQIYHFVNPQPNTSWVKDDVLVWAQQFAHTALAQFLLASS